ncbi:uncharacterized protein FOMMEDRAFT_26299 [Fomitiporia mediterranea MF3/22]|uniref:uncharacterized protein n=1 Tax=Fomitiporia mediterranea (strain MF3/22) TaxID=694068 RepID=UPI0004407EDA|nr:uncharacterized protein FOMMEDRAFT_26299 [Fomitiporia mediterranea MF3/22]EJD05358.1 hypothetical protein FOMMEDRAFT_26299 [Fomitiporia mediterranea MF3/22]
MIFKKQKLQNRSNSLGVDYNMGLAFELRPTSQSNSILDPDVAVQEMQADEQLLDKCLFEDEPRALDELTDLKNVVKYPRFIKDEKVIQAFATVKEDKIKNSNPCEDNFNFEDWVISIPEEKFESGDPFSFQDCYESLLQDWELVIKAGAKRETMHDGQRGINFLLRQAFELRPGAKHIYQLEKELTLPGTDDLTRADVIPTRHLSQNWYSFQRRLPKSQVLRSLTTNEERISFVTSLLHFEEDDDASTMKRELMLRFCYAQCQHLALGLKDLPVYGALLTDSMLTIYASIWNEDRIIICPTNITFNLKSFPEFIDCYFFLCKLSDHIAHQIERAFERPKSEEPKDETQKQQQEESANSWSLSSLETQEEEDSSDLDLSDESPRRLARDQSSDSEESEVEYSENDPEVLKIAQQVENGEPAPEGGYQLDRKHLLALDVYNKRHEANSTGHSRVQDWVNSLPSFENEPPPPL